MKAKWFSTLLVVLLMVVAMVPAAEAAPSSAGLPQDESIGTNSDNGQHPLGENQAMLMAKGLDAKLHGNAPEK
ncbi:MAG: hypothetical protein ACM3XO_20260, partial [Bacteroidota bacterium]